MPQLGALGSALRLLRACADRKVLLDLLATLLLVALGASLAAGSPLALKHLVDAVAEQGLNGPSGAVMTHGTVYLVVLIGARLASDLRPLLAGRIEQRVLARLRQRFFAHLLRLPLAYLANRRGAELLHSADLAAAGAQAMVSHATSSIAPTLIELAWMTAILAQLQQPALVAVFVATSLLYLAVFAFGVRAQRPAVEAVSGASLAVYGRLSDGAAQVETLRCFGATQAAERALAGASSRLITRWLRLHRLTAYSGLAASTIFALALAASFYIAADAVALGEITVGGFVLANVYMLQMVRPLETLGAATRDLTRAVGFMRPLLDILAEPAEAGPSTPPTGAERRDDLQAPALRLEDVYFGYDPHRPVLRGLSLDIPAGRTTAIIGRSGCGKSSLARLLLRLYAPQAGRILVDGCPIETLPVDALRAMIGWVPQDPGLLRDTVKANIALGRPGATADDIQRAARHAHIHQHIAGLPRGYDTLLGERGQTLSGGERQRLALARAVLREPRLYVLDEPTSMLDARTEAAVLGTLRELTAGCTTLVIAHRLSTVMHADDIVVLEDGRVRERGSHAQLLAMGGLYAQLWRQQAEGTA